ncbi:hypothetical protein [Algiphilus sp.]|uniref:hypothetical protein n=1 Tax=Algiphilus sp. TaxID=1872431 RepID=UPI0032EC6457
MRAQRLVPTALAVMALILGGCSRVEESEDGGIPKGNLVSLFEPTTGTVPFPFDGLFSGFTDPTLNIPSSQPPAQAANELDGWSTTASIFTDFIGFLDFDTTAAGIRIIALPDGQAPQVLVEGEDYRVTDYPATSAIPNTNPPVIAPTNSFRTRVLIQPLKPLSPATRHIVVLTNDLRDVSGERAVPSTQFRIASRTTPVSQQDDLIVNTLPASAIATLESLQQQIVLPTLQGVTAVTGLAREDIVLAWPFTTQSVGESLGRIAEQADARAATEADAALSIIAAPSGLTLADIGAPDLGQIFIGAVDLPYYLQAPGNGNPDGVVNSGFWQADPTKPNLGTQDNPTTFLGQVPCGAFAAGAMGFTPSTSTTRCFPQPVERSIERSPLLATVPSQVAKPASGWPVVIFQHGITSDRTAMLALAPRLAAAGFVAVAIDLPLHGIPPADCTQSEDPLCPARQQLRGANDLFGARERTFDVDLQAPEGIDASGANYINLPSLLTARDNNRQAVADLLHLRAILPRLNLDQQPGGDIDAQRVYFFGHSLGGIVGSTFVALDDDVRAASLANPGGGIGKLLDGSRSIGPQIRAGLAASGVEEGTDGYESFLQFAQQVVDSGDPINYAGRLSERPVHFIEVVDDLVVPNTVPRNPPAEAPGNDPTLDRVVVAGPLSGSTPLIEAIGLDLVTVEDVSGDAIVRTGAEASAAVRFTQGDHSVVLTPPDSPINQEMQNQIVNFLASDGQCLPIRGSCQ